ncbi:heme chaperone HemW-like [Lolium rigidum]|uniref:heme chaperone HemW-like n=1 Tax=Lolium rigidum TaxID=89674 RepID=UPI001F5DF843|nr:heme chaperone HemW-like [Lolium rigidum]
MLRSAFPLVFQFPHRRKPPPIPPRPPPVRRYASPAAAFPPLPPASAYVHLPFCRKRCHYCDFPIVALGSSSPFPRGDGDGDDPRISDYVRLLLREVAATRPVSDDGVPLETIFFGGGTPSLVPPKLVAAVLDALRANFGLSACPEVSIEMDPGTFDAAKLRDLVGVGVNRVSLGVQAFQEGLLRSCGRAHGLREVHEAVGIVTGCEGLQNWSMDLISSLPNQTQDMWEESLRCTIDARPTHVSVYDLQIEQGTKFGQMYTPGVFPLPNETDSANFYKIASKRLSEAGYQHYEISSYCKTGYECKHNVTYWQNRPFYAFGLGSASYINGVRFSRPRRMKDYADWVQKLEDGTWCHESSTSELKDMAMDSVMLSLRTASGLDLHRFSKSFGKNLTLSLCTMFRPFVESGLVIAMDTERQALQLSEFDVDLENKGDTGSRVAFIRLSDPDGFLLSNELISLAFGIISP